MAVVAQLGGVGAQLQRGLVVPVQRDVRAARHPIAALQHGTVELDLHGVEGGGELRVTSFAVGPCGTAHQLVAGEVATAESAPMPLRVPAVAARIAAVEARRRHALAGVGQHVELGVVEQLPHPGRIGGRAVAAGAGAGHQHLVRVAHMAPHPVHHHHEVVETAVLECDRRSGRNAERRVADAGVGLVGRAGVDVAGAVRYVDHVPVAHRVGRVVALEEAVHGGRVGAGRHLRHEELRHVGRQACDREAAAGVVPAGAAALEVDGQVARAPRPHPEGEPGVGAGKTRAAGAVQLAVQAPHRLLARFDALPDAGRAGASGVRGLGNFVSTRGAGQQQGGAQQGQEQALHRRLLDGEGSGVRARRQVRQRHRPQQLAALGG